MATRRTKTVAAKSSTSFLHRGNEGRQRMEREIAAAKKRREMAGAGRLPFRFRMQEGETKEFVVLDDNIDVFGYEHVLRNPKTNKWSEVVSCVGEGEICQACEEVGASSYVMYLSVLDLSPYEDKDGNEQTFSRKLLVVKMSQQKVFARTLEREGTLRGAIFEASRDGPKDAAIGNDIQFIEFMDEDELVNDYIREWTDRDGNVHTENCGEPYNYDEVIAPPDAEAISMLLGKEHVVSGSRREARELEEEDDTPFEEDEQDAGVWEEEEAEQTTTRGSRRTERGGSSTRVTRSTRSTRSSRSSDPTEEQEEPTPSSLSTRTRAGTGSRRTTASDTGAGRRSARRSTRR